MSIGEAEEKWQKALDELKNCMQNKKKEMDDRMLEIHEVELLEETEKEKTKSAKCSKM